MDEFAIFTDAIVNEVMTSSLDLDDQKALIYKRFSDKEFTMIGARKEIRIIEDRICENTVNKFYNVCAVTLSLLSALIFYLFLDNIIEGILLLKIFAPIIVSSVLFSIFSTTLNDMKNKCEVYKLCHDRVTDILEQIEMEYNKSEMKKAIEANNEKSSIFNVGKPIAEETDLEDSEGVDSVEIDAFDFDLEDLLEDEEEEDLGAA